MSDKKTHWKKLTDSPYLGSYSFGDGEEGEYTIKKVTSEEVISNGGKKSKKPVIHFEEGEVKPMVVNSGNARRISALAGSEAVEDWIGVKVVVFVKDGVKQPEGGYGPGLCIRTSAETSKKRASTGLEDKHKKQISSSDTDAWTKLVEWVKSDKGSLDKAFANYKMSAADRKKLEEETK